MLINIYQLKNKLLYIILFLFVTALFTPIALDVIKISNSIEKNIDADTDLNEEELQDYTFTLISKPYKLKSFLELEDEKVKFSTHITINYLSNLTEIFSPPPEIA